MALHRNTSSYRSIFLSSTRQEQDQNFDLYWQFCQAYGGELFRSRARPHQETRHPPCLPSPSRACSAPLTCPRWGVFYRNYVRCQAHLATIDRKTLLLVAIYKIACHEWVGITGPWDAAAPFSEAHHVITKICRYHLAEEFGHIRLFHEMFLTFHLDRVTWGP